MAEECLKQANDLCGLLLLYSSQGDADGITQLASLAKEHGKNNVAFLCLFMLGKLEDCLQLLVDSNQIPEAALMARSYLPSQVSEIVAHWRKDLNKIWDDVSGKSITTSASQLEDLIDRALELGSATASAKNYGRKYIVYGKNFR
ncbi:unnamed protein product [Fraxinus pennsylvanica]|uniref:COPA/B TPR domain-containing protein n=1 Tax=Fraxinus pennsylvanica TaxID=56036 RepID=A0AAD1Z477_9LAMI|nr:unnamed protein product [Fraxinus pennsylvanica]